MAPGLGLDVVISLPAPSCVAMLEKIGVVARRAVISRMPRTCHVGVTRGAAEVGVA